ncbi:MAG: hypothetical protein ABJG68_12885 [Crocinitomicaceae bacterium]
MIQKYDFHCTSCHHKLSDDKHIKLTTKRGDEKLGLIKLSTSVGQYDYFHEPAVEFEPGEMITFCCTECDASLNSKEFPNYALLKMKVNEDIQFEVLFSRKAGVQKTYLVTEDGIETYTGT